MARELKMTVNRIKKEQIIFSALMVLFFFSGSVFAHTFTIQSSRYGVTENSSKPMLIGWGHYIPLDDAIHGKKIKFLNVIDPDGEKKEIIPEKIKGLHSYMIDYNKPGTWCITGDTNPGYYTIYLDKNGKEHHAIKPKSKIKRAVSIKMSLYTSQSSKAYVHCGDSSEKFNARTGLDLELVPLKNPALIKPGEALSFEVWFKGKKYTGKGKWDATFSGFSQKANTWFISDQKAENGKFSVTPDRAGVWFVRYQFKRKPGKEELKHCNDFSHKTTLVFPCRGL